MGIRPEVPMPTDFRPQIYAIDFGTSNSLLAAANREKTHPPIALDDDAADPTILRSILFFGDNRHRSTGARALRDYVANGLRGRLIRSIKRFLPSSTFVSTQIGDARLELEDLVGALLGEMRTRANAHFGADVDRVVLGRPAVFSRDREEDALAEARLVRAADRAGFREIRLCPEPIAAAHDYRRTLAHDEVALVADFGAGTSDFTVVRLRKAGYQASDVLAIGGVPLAGDAYDGALMRHRIAVHFGSEVNYRMPFGGNVLTMPRHLTEKLCSPADICWLARRDVAQFLREVRGGALGPDDRRRIDQLLCLAEDGLGFSIFEAIEHAKIELSRQPSTRFHFQYPTMDIDEVIDHRAFAIASAEQTDAILGSLDETVRSAGIRADDIDVVCATGGTAKVPAILAGLRQRFGDERLRQLRTFHSVIQGLAERARDLA
jgi:hypothetical chaperone protein